MGAAITRRSPGGLSPWQTRAVEREIAEAQVPARVAAARVRSAAYVGFVGMSCCQALTVMESQAFRMAPTGEERYTAIVNAYAGMVVAELGQLAFTR